MNITATIKQKETKESFKGFAISLKKKNTMKKKKETEK